MYYYKVYNFTIQVPFKIDELIEISPQKTDIRISEGSVKSVLHDNIVTEGSFFSDAIIYSINSNNDILLSIKDIGYFKINKSSIEIERLEAVSDNDVVLYLLGTCFAYLLMLNGLYAIHGSALKTGNGCIVFTGDSGVGKSTTAARLIEKGYPLLADDVCVITFDSNKKPVVHPAYPQLKLWDNSIEKLGYNKDELKSISTNWAKYRMPAKDLYEKDELQLFQIFELAPSEINNIEIENLTGFQKIKSLLENTYRNFFIPTLKLENHHFQFCSQIAQQVEVKKIHRPQNQFLLDELIDTIETNMKCEPKIFSNI